MERLGLHDGLCTALCVQFATDIEDVLLDRVHTQDQMAGNLPVGSAIQEQPEDLTFTAGKWLRKSGCAGGAAWQPLKIVPTGMGRLAMSRGSLYTSPIALRSLCSQLVPN